MDPHSQRLQEYENCKLRHQALKEKMNNLANLTNRKRRSPLKENQDKTVDNDTDENKKQCLGTGNGSKVAEHFTSDSSLKSNGNARGKSRFAALAASINQWEDEENSQPCFPNIEQKKEISNPNSFTRKNNIESKSNFNFGKEKTTFNGVRGQNEPKKLSPRKDEVINPSSPAAKSIKKDLSTEAESNVDVKKKVCVWDKAVMATLEAQGFTKSPSASKLSYDYPQTVTEKSNKLTFDSETKKQQLNSNPIAKKSDVVTEKKELSVSDRISMFSKPQKRKSEVDPALMSLSARVALFENAMDKPIKQNASKKHHQSRPVEFEVETENITKQSPIKTIEVTEVKKVLSPSKNSSSELTKHVHQNLFHQMSDNWQKNEISAKVKAEREQELDALRNRFGKYTEKNKVDAEGVSVQKKKLEPEIEEENVESEIDESFREEILVEDDRYDEQDDYSQESSLCDVSEVEEKEVSNLSADVADACGEIDKMLDEAIDTNFVEIPEEPEIFTKPGHLYPSLDNFKTPNTEPSPKKIVEEAPVSVPLVHTVSFYRRQNDMQKTPVKKLIRREVLSPPSPSEQRTKKQESIQQQIKELQGVVNAQQTIISQTSQALNLCRATAEFYGSSEQIEGERLLLIATQRRQACLNEITRLKTEAAMIEVKRDSNFMESQGILTLNDIRLPLKKAFLVATAEGKNDNYVHNFLCLIRHGSQIISTEMISTQQGSLSSGSLSFSNMITIHNLDSEFCVNFEVYGLQCPKEILPHDRKYHIKKDSSKLKLTPKKKQDMRLLTSPAIASPGGPLAIRTSSFAIIGHFKLCLKNLSRKVFMLEKIPSTSPLEGNVYMKVQCHADLRVDQRGFLTMFEDVSGFGAWHRRWCVLTGQHLAYWKYPDDEKRKDPIGYIDLRRCVTGTVQSAPREICARLNTIMLVSMRPTSDGDEDDLITQKYDTVTTTRHLLSSDSKEEKNWWCDKINQALTNIRKWDAQALRPIDKS